MLNHTYCHIPGIGPAKEKQLWAKGITSWDTILKNPAFHTASFVHYVSESSMKLQQGDLSYFSEALCPKQHWRLAPHVFHSLAYVDIETTGDHFLHGGKITTIALYDGNAIRTYVRGQNLYDFIRDIQNYDGMVTYNGRCFDKPFIEYEFNISLNITHIDLRYILAGIGLRGGLKGCERSIGIDREELNGVDGRAAVTLWELFRREQDPRVLETLLAYNVEDVINLEQLLHYAYHKNLGSTPFLETNLLPEKRSEPANPFVPSPAILRRVEPSYPRF